MSGFKTTEKKNDVFISIHYNSIICENELYLIEKTMKLNPYEKTKNSADLKLNPRDIEYWKTVLSLMFSKTDNFNSQFTILFQIMLKIWFDFFSKFTFFAYMRSKINVNILST